MQVLLIALIVMSTCSHISAAPREILDQSNFLPESGSGGQLMGLIERDFSQAQTFTPALTGQLLRVELGVLSRTWPATDDLHVEIRRLVAGVPSESPGDVLGSQSIAYAEIPTKEDVDVFIPYSTVSVDFSSDFVNLLSGVEYAIVLTSDTTHSITNLNAYSWWSSSQGDDLYLHGTSAGTINSGPSTPHPWIRSDQHVNTTKDMHFATYMLVPEPRTFTILVNISLAFLITNRGRS